MEMFNNSPVVSLNVFEVEFNKKETVFVPEREFYSLTFRTEGKISLVKGDRCLLSGPMSITFVPKGVSYNTEILQDGSMIAVHFDMLCDNCLCEEPLVLEVKNPDVYVNLFKHLIERYSHTGGSDYSCFSLFYSILSELSKEGVYSGENMISKRMADARAYINRSFSSPGLSVESVSYYLGISTVYLRKEFKKTFGCTPVSYIQSVRCDNARILLETGYYTVSDVAEMCGFLSLSYFSYVFRKVYGISPGGYMKNKNGIRGYN